MKLFKFPNQIENDGTHSPIGGSAAARFLKCGASVQLQLLHDLPPEAKSKAAKLGTELHDMAETSLLEGTKPKKEIKAYVDYCRKLMTKHKAYAVEPVLARTDIHEDMRGAIDFVAFTPLQEIEIVDLKTGSYKVSSGSEQLKYYLVLVASLKFPFKKYKATIHQGGKVETTVYTKKEIEDFAKVLSSQIHKMYSKEQAEPHEGSHCTFCKAKPVCSKHAVSLDNLLKTGVIDNKNILKVSQDIENAEIKVAALKSKVVKKLLDFEAKGIVVDGIEIKHSYTREGWINTDALEELLGDKSFKLEKKYLTPKQLQSNLKENEIDKISKLVKKKSISSSSFKLDS